MTKRKGRRKQRQPRKTSSPNVSNASLSRRGELARDHSMSALRAMRHGTSASRAARENGVSLRTLKQYAGGALVQDRPGGRFRATKSDRLVRYLQIPGPHGPVEIKVRGSRAASEVARYKSAVNRFLGGDRHALAKWHGKKIAGVELITAGNILVDQADKGLLPYALYRSLSGGTV
jgi:hypothetical protein